MLGLRKNIRLEEEHQVEDSNTSLHILFPKFVYFDDATVLQL